MLWSEELHIEPQDPTKIKPKQEKKNKKKAQKEKIKSVFYLNKNVEIIDYDFDTYVECGMKLDATYAIDFTISNGNFHRGEPSLHAVDYQQRNLYTQIIEELGSEM